MKLANIWVRDNLQKSYDEAKQMIIKTTQLTHPDLQAQIALKKGASDYTAEPTLEQFSDTQWRPLGFGQSIFWQKKRKWSIYCHEIKAV